MTIQPPPNGNALLMLLQDTLAIVDELDLLGYYQLPLPANSDKQLRQIVETLAALPYDQQTSFFSGLTEGQRALFGIFALRAATLSLRKEEPAWLTAGLLGLVVANYTIPRGRPVELALAIFYYCARELGLDPSEHFATAARVASEEMALKLMEFGRQPEISLRHYGWKVVRTPEGVLFRNEWRL